MKTILWVAILLAAVGSVAAQTNEGTPLGRSLSEIGEPIGTPQRSNVSISGTSIQDAKSDPLDRRALHTRLSAVVPDVPFKARGPKDVTLYAKASPSVVLVVTNHGIGSGSLISADGRILTNWHVVGKAQEVGVIFKPSSEGRTLTRADAQRAHVLRVDQIADLALISVGRVPPGYRALEFGTMADVQVGSDVHAIGHPTGEAWTYTKGLVSQIRKGYEWATESSLKHRADVIQTQTPINPGNSGGPLLTEEGRIVGVNSFKAKGEALNFAVNVDEIRRFLAATSDRHTAVAPKPKPPASSSTCQVRELKKGRNKENNADVTWFDANCDGIWDAFLIVPDDRTKPIMFCMDTKNTGKVDVVVVDENRDGKWDFSLHDIDGDGKPDLIGRHADGQLKASSFEPYLASR